MAIHAPILLMSLLVLAAEPQTPPPLLPLPQWTTTPLFQGVTLMEARGAGESGLPLAAFALRIELATPGLRFLTTPDNGDRPGETDAQPVSQFLVQHQLSAATNANFFSPCCKREAGEGKEVLGIAISDGQVVSAGNDSGQRDVLTLSADNQARIVPEGEVQPALVRNAVAGHRILKSGKVTGREGGTRHPRTAAGISADGRHLILLVIDGRQIGYSMGATATETARLLVHAGAAEGINLDGGGSTTLAVAQPGRDVRIINRPSEAAERYVGSAIGLAAPPLPEGP